MNFPKMSCKIARIGVANFMGYLPNTFLGIDKLSTGFSHSTFNDPLLDRMSRLLLHERR